MTTATEPDIEAATAYNARHAADVDADSEMLARLVAYWQAGHGLGTDGKIGTATRASLMPAWAAPVAPPPAISAISAIPANPSAIAAGYTAADVVNRLRPFVGAGLNVGRYVLGGGAPHTAPSPFKPIGDWLAERYPTLTPETLGCDCSGMVAWGCGYRRGNYNTDAIVADAWVSRYGKPTDRPGPRRLYLPVDPGDLRPGDVLVYAGPDRNMDGHRDSPGHTGVVSEVEPGTVLGSKGWHERVKVIHCSSRDQAKMGAIRETNAALWWDVTRSIAARCRLVRYEP